MHFLSISLAALPLPFGTLGKALFLLKPSRICRRLVRRISFFRERQSWTDYEKRTFEKLTILLGVFITFCTAIVRRCFEVQQNGDYCYYPTNGSLALGVVGIRSIFFVGSARWIQLAIVVSVVVLLVDSWQKREKIHSIN